MLRGTEGSPGRAGRAWRSTRVGAFVTRLNGRPEELDRLAERFPRRQRRQLLLALAGVTVVASAVRIPLLGTPYTSPDTDQYLAVAEQIFHGGFPDNLRPPGFSLILALFDALGADPVTAVVVLQNLIGIALPAAVLLVGWRFFSPAVGIVAGFLTAASPLTIVTEQLALSDYLFGVLLFIATTLLAEAALRIHAGRKATRLLIAAGAVFGIAALFRANGLIALVAIPVVALIAAPGWRPALRASAIAVAAMAVIVAPWSLHNLIRFGDPNLSTESGLSLYARAIGWDQVRPPASSPEGRLARDIFNTADINQTRASLGKTIVVFNALVNERGMSAAEASSTMGALARETIREHPRAYLDGTTEILGLYRGLYDPKTFLANEYLDQIITVRNYFRSLDPTIREVPGNSALTRVPWQAAQTLSKLLYVITLGGAIALLLAFMGRTRSRLAASTFLAVALIGALGGAMTSRWEPRYDVVFAPMVWLLLAAAAVLIVEVLVAAVRQRAWRRPQGAEL